MRRVLYLAYYFPPDGGAGTQRSLKFCKYLGHFGWSPTVITRDDSRKRGYLEALDEGFLAELPPDVSIVRVLPEGRERTSGPGVNDSVKSYLESFYKCAARELQTGKFDVLFITMSPFDLARIGIRLKSEFGIPVIYDLRDPWALDGWRSYRTKLHWLLDLRLMRRALGTANGIVANTPESAIAFEKLLIHSRLKPRIEIIPNGYDGDDFSSLRSTHLPTSRDEFVVVHAGTLHTVKVYPKKSLIESLKSMLRYRPEPINVAGRTEMFLYSAVKILQEEGHPLGQQFRFVCVGHKSDSNVRCVHEAGLEKCVIFTGYLTHQESLDWLARSDALFLPLHDLPSGHRSLIVPGKTYEYLAANRPILGALPPGDARDLLMKAPMGFVASPCDPQEIAMQLRKIYDFREENDKVQEMPTWIHEYERRQLTERLAGYLDEVIGYHVGGEKMCVRSRLEKSFGKDTNRTDF